MKELFLHIHLTKESERLLMAGQYDESSDGMDFCTRRWREIYESYCRNMIKKYGGDEAQHPLGDIDVWRNSAGEGRELYGIRSSDPNFIVTGLIHLLHCQDHLMQSFSYRNKRCNDK